MSKENEIGILTTFISADGEDQIKGIKSTIIDIEGDSVDCLAYLSGDCIRLDVDRYKNIKLTEDNLLELLNIVREANDE